jgi:hypothetical protein
MKRIFVETREFTDWFRSYLTDEALARMQGQLLGNPDLGEVMPGCGGLRKLRIADPARQKGKRGGARVIYLNLPEMDQIVLITVYGKDQKDDLTPEDKAQYRRLVQVLKQQARRRAAGDRRGHP